MSLERRKIKGIDIEEETIENAHLVDSTIRFAKMKAEHKTATSVADTDTTVAHTLGITPVTVVLTAKTTGAAGYGRLVSKSSTCIIIRGSISGVDLDIDLYA